MARLVHRLTYLALAGLLTACSPLKAVNLLVPRTGYTVRQAIAYGPEPRQKLDVYIPDGLKGPAPVLLFFYGGGWQSGSRADYAGVGQAFASEGIVTLVADYRLYPQATFPAFVEDAARAAVFAHAHVAEWGGDPKRLFVAGHSAGAYNAVMLGSDPSYLKTAGADLSWIAGIIGIAGPYDFLPLTDPSYTAIFHGRNNRIILPIAHIGDAPHHPAMLLITGGADGTVGPGNSTRMAAALKAHGDRAEVITYRGIGHIGIIASLLPPLRFTAPLRRDMLRFIQSR